MWSSRGRPQSACTTCKSQKVRCSGERPVCKRCARLPRTCVYAPNKATQRPLRIVQDSRSLETLESTWGNTAKTINLQDAAKTISLQDHDDTGHSVSESRPLISQPAIISMHKDSPYLGISETLMYTLVELYFENAYNASLLLHKDRFTNSLMAGNVEAHLILSICAYAANFYRDQGGDTPLRDHGFMLEWAKRAGSLVFREAEMLCEDNIVTFCILSTFWYGQGSWRLAYLHKANSCNLLHIAGLSFAKQSAYDFLESEIRRRRFWACYLMQCALMEDPSSFESIANVSQLPLPFSEADFETGVASSLPTTLDDHRPDASIYAELIRGFKYWSTVFSLVKLPESTLGDRFSKIYALDDALTNWWSDVRSEIKLTTATLSHIPLRQLPQVLLVNVMYHQCICALHASVVPLFSWTQSDEKWAAARQASAQRTYEHACIVSHLITATLSVQPNVAMTHSFLAYAAYSGCAVQLPFAWSSNAAIKTRATTNVAKNVEMIQLMAPYWKFAAVLQKQFGHLYRIHERRAVDLEDEPKNIDVRKLIDFKINATNARASILGFTDILRLKDHGYATSGEESNDLGIQDQSDQIQLDATAIASISEESDTEAIPHANGNNSVNLPGQETNLLPIYMPDEQPVETLRLASGEGDNDHLTQMYMHPSGSIEVHHSPTGVQPYELWRPFFHPNMMDFFSNNDMTNLSQVDIDSVHQTRSESNNWFSFTNL